MAGQSQEQSASVFGGAGSSRTPFSQLRSDITDEPRRSDESTYDEYVEVSTISRQIFGVLRHNEAGVQAR